MKINISSNVSSTEWDQTVLNCDGNLFHTYGYTVFETSKSNQTPLYISLVDSNSNVCSVAVVIIETPKYWPFSRYCKKAILSTLPASNDPNLIISFMQKIEILLKKQGVFDIFIHAYDSIDSNKVLSKLNYQLSNRSEFYLSLTEDKDAIWQKLKGNRRNKIRKSEKLGVVSKSETSLEAVIHLKKLQQSALARKDVHINNSDSISNRIKTKLIDNNRALTITSYKDDIALNAGLFGFYNGRVYYIISGSSLDGNKNSGPAHMIWHTVCQFKEMGYKVLNLGGVSEEESQNQSGLYSFKKDFGAEIIYQPSGHKIISFLGNSLHKVECKIKMLLKR